MSTSEGAPAPLEGALESRVHAHAGRTEETAWSHAERYLAGSIWTTTLVVVLYAVVAGRVTAIPYAVYATAAERWAAHQPLYETASIDGFQYLPQAAMLFVPFAGLGVVGAEIAWRSLWWLLYAAGTGRLARSLLPERTRGFSIATCLAVGPAIRSLANGQANLALAALTLHIAADLAAQNWWRATLLIALGMALKPLMAVLLLLAWALYRPLAWRLPLALAAVTVAPFLAADAPYVKEQYATLLIKLGMTSTPDRLFEDLRGLIASLGWLMPHAAYRVVSAIAALAVLCAARSARQRVPEPRASALLAALAVGYLVVFNPRTLASSYVMTSCLAGVFATGDFLAGRRARALMLASICLAWTLNRHWPGFAFIQYWLKPAAGLAFLGLTLQEAWGRSRTTGPA